ncbi:Anti-sigma factor antagonist [Candidatus Magnetomorum sp. HK-1]|nr:Anti-sigma factor antagonist [Candidatus Magnetomorum sp. HK-1]
MIVLCEKCQKKYRIDDNKIPKKGLNVRCSKCKNIFSVKPTHESLKKSLSSESSTIKNPVQNQNSQKQTESQSKQTDKLKPVKTKVSNLPDFAEWDEDIIVVTLPGETLDAANCQDFKEAIHSILETPNQVLFNMENIKFVDSSGCGTLNTSIKRIKKHGGDIKICNVLDQVAAIFRLIKLNRVFHICDTREDAIQAYKVG